MSKKIIVMLLALSVLLVSCSQKDDIDDVGSTESKPMGSEAADITSSDTKPEESTPDENEPEECVHVVVVDEAVAASCMKTGLSEGSHCSICGHIIEAQNTIPAPGHTYDDEYDDKCNACDHVRDVECKHENQETLPALAATCKTTGLTEGKKCADCEDIIVLQNIIPVIEHTEEKVEGKAPTCKATGLTEGKKCSECGDILEAQEIIPALDHTYDDKYDDTCNVCGGGKREVPTRPGNEPSVDGGVVQLPIDPF